MKLFLDHDTLVGDIKRLFTTYYPYLKIEFYKTPIGDNHNQTKKEIFTINSSLGKALKIAGKAEINADKSITVAELENQFANVGLNTEVFRKSGTVWIETSLTDNWTLQQQNDEAEELSKQFIQQ